MVVNTSDGVYFHTMKLLLLPLAICAIGAVLPPMPGSGTMAGSTVKGGQNQMVGAMASFVAANPPPTIVTLAADFSPTQISNLWAFCEVKTDLTNAWGRIATLPYPASGGTFAVSYTNASPTIYFRFGYQFSR